MSLLLSGYGGVHQYIMEIPELRRQNRENDGFLIAGDSWEPTFHRSVRVFAVKGDIGTLSFRPQKTNFFTYLLQNGKKYDII